MLSIRRHECGGYSLKKSLWLLGVVLCSGSLGASEPVRLSAFTQSTLLGWEPQEFQGLTEYTFVKQNHAVQTVALCADSDASASGWVRELTVDLQKTPYLKWRWKLEQGLPTELHTEKAGDDFALRLYLVKKHWLAWKNQSINYVWANRANKDSHWDNPFAPKQVKLLALNDANDPPGQWVEHVRDVRADAKRLFGEAWEQVDVIAIMTDSDNSAGRARACYGDMGFYADRN